VALCHVDARSDQIRVDSCLGAYISLPLLSAYFNLPPPSIFDNALSFEACHKTAGFFANLTTTLCDCIYTGFFLIKLFTTYILMRSSLRPGYQGITNGSTNFYKENVFLFNDAAA